jgi:hypothetical protein
MLVGSRLSARRLSDQAMASAFQADNEPASGWFEPFGKRAWGAYSRRNANGLREASQLSNYLVNNDLATNKQRPAWRPNQSCLVLISQDGCF